MPEQVEPNILIVDDDAVIQRNIEKVLTTGQSRSKFSGLKARNFMLYANLLRQNDAKAS